MKSALIRTLRVASAGLLAVGISSCSPKKQFDDHGLRSFEIRMPAEDVGGLLADAAGHVQYSASVVVDGELRHGKISAAGATTIFAIKKSLNLEFTDGTIEGMTDVRLSTTISDSTMLRALMASEIFAAAGVPISRIEPVYVYLNDRNLGLYFMVEKVDKEFFEKRSLPTDTLYETKGDADFGPSFEARVGNSIKSEFGSENVEIFTALTRTLRLSDDTEFYVAVTRLLNEESVLNYMAGGALINQWDGFNKNLYYYLDSSNRLSLVPWDFDLAWKEETNVDPAVWNLNFLYSRLAKVPAFRARLIARITELSQTVGTPSHIESRLQFWQEKIAGAYAVDPVRGAAGYDLPTQVADLRRRIDEWIAELIF